MNKIKKFFSEYSDELINRVHWPKTEDLQIQTIYVIIVSILFAIMIGLMDGVFSLTLRFLYDTF